MRNFTTEDFEGAGHYIIRNDSPAGTFTNPGFMSTILKKVGWMHGKQSNNYLLIDMSDGLVQNGYYFVEGEEKEYILFSGTTNHEAKQKLVDYLNNPELSQEYRFATQEEVIRVVMHQSSRWR